jgi:DNA modification methylase
MEAASETPEAADALTHGFHTYPARMHPVIAAHAIECFAGGPEARVLDPFCGSGTVLVEAMRMGLSATGVDLSPLALRVAETHVAITGKRDRARFLECLQAISEASFERVQTRTKALAPLSQQERAFYAPHVLLELAGLREEIAAITHERDRRACQIVLSSLLVKLSNKRADTSDEQLEKRLRKGLATELFVRKGRELCERWQLLANALPKSAREPRLVLGDARELPKLVRERFDLIVSSPPYGGTYDYYAHHALRYPWLGLDVRALQAREVGARRHLSRDENVLDDRASHARASHTRSNHAHKSSALERWEAELLACLRAIAKVTHAQSRIVLLVGDAELSGRRFDAALQLRALARRAGLSLLAVAAQPRPDHHGGAPRREHLCLLVHDRR